MVAPKAKPPKLVGATLDSALARQARAKKNLVFVDVQLTAIQQQMEEARAEMVLADKAVNEARQLAVQDTVIFADVEVLVQAMRTQTLDPAAREDLARMTDALTSMRAMQQAQQPVSTPLTPMTPTVTQGTERFQELQVTQEAVLREAMRQGENTAVGQSRQGSRTPQEGRKRLTAEELREGLENDLGEKWSEIDEEVRSRFVQAVNDRLAPFLNVG